MYTCCTYAFTSKHDCEKSKFSLTGHNITDVVFVIFVFLALFFFIFFFLCLKVCEGVVHKHQQEVYMCTSLSVIKAYPRA